MSEECSRRALYQPLDPADDLVAGLGAGRKAAAVHELALDRREEPRRAVVETDPGGAHRLGVTPSRSHRPRYSLEVYWQPLSEPRHKRDQDAPEAQASELRVRRQPKG